MAALVPCPACGAQVPESHPATACPQCGQVSAGDFGLEPVQEETFGLAPDEHTLTLAPETVPVRVPGERSRPVAKKKKAAAPKVEEESPESAAEEAGLPKNAAEWKAWVWTHKLLTALAGATVFTFLLFFVFSWSFLLSGFFAFPGAALTLLGVMAPRVIPWTWNREPKKKKKVTSLSDPDPDDGNAFAAFMNTDVIAVSGGGILGVMVLLSRLGRTANKLGKTVDGYQPRPNESLGGIFLMVALGTGAPLLFAYCAYKYGPYRAAAWGYLAGIAAIDLAFLWNRLG